MRLRKKMIGWLAFLSVIAAIGLASCAGYVCLAPFFRGAYQAFYVEGKYQVNEGFTYDLARDGLNAADSDMLAKYNDWLGKPKTRSGWSVIDDFVPRKEYAQLPEGDPAMAAAALVDTDGKTIATYPADLIKIAPEFDGTKDLENGSFDLSPLLSDTSDSPWIKLLGSKLTPEQKQRVDEAFAYSIYKDDKPLGKLLVLWNPNRGDIAVVPPSSRVHSPLSALTLAIMAGLMLLAHIILLPIWAGMDAGWRGMRSLAWATLVLVTGWIGLLAYLIARLSPPFPCPNCGEQVLSKFRRCPVCGVSLLTRCPLCRSRIKPGWQYCPTCSGVPGEIEGPWLPGVATEQPSLIPAALTVTIVDADTGDPCPNAHVSVQGPTTFGGITNHNGLFQAKELEPGNYIVSVVRLGSEPAKAEVEIAQDSPQTIEIKLTPQPGRIVGRILDAAFRKPIVGARVSIDSTRIDLSATTDDSGAYELSDIPAGPYTVVAEADGFQTQTRLIRVALGRQVPAEFILEPVPEAVAGAAEGGAQ